MLRVAAVVENDPGELSKMSPVF
jgi:hypothetical protein